MAQVGQFLATNEAELIKILPRGQSSSELPHTLGECVRGEGAQWARTVKKGKWWMALRRYERLGLLRGKVHHWAKSDGEEPKDGSVYGELRNFASWAWERCELAHAEEHKAYKAHEKQGQVGRGTRQMKCRDSEPLKCWLQPCQGMTW